MSHLSPSARNGKEDFRRILDECRLLFQCEHQVSIALGLRGKRSKLSAADTECRCSGVSVLFHAVEAESNAAKIFWCHSQQGSRYEIAKLQPVVDGGQGRETKPRDFRRSVAALFNRYHSAPVAITR